MSDLSPETQELLRQARGPEAMPSARRRKLKGAVLARVAVASSTVLAAPAAASLFGAGAKVAVGLVVAASLGTGGYIALRPHAPHAARVAVAAPVVAASVVTPVLAEASPLVEPAEMPAMTPPHHLVAHHVAVHVRGGDSIVAETSLLRDADRDLRAERPRDALGLLERHRARYPHGVLAPERDAATLIARCELGTESRRDVDGFLATHVGSPLAARVRVACAPGGANVPR